MLNPPPSLDDAAIELWESLCARLITLNERVWEGSVNGPAIEQ